jgi:signal transduction histidine kinase
MVRVSHVKWLLLAGLFLLALGYEMLRHVVLEGHSPKSVVSALVFYGAIVVSLVHLTFSRIEKQERMLKEYSQSLEAKVEERTRELVEAKKRSEFYLDLMSHDIANLNTVILGSLDALVMDPGIKGERKELITSSFSAAKKSSNIIDSVRKIQLMQSEEEASLEEVALKDVLAEAVEKVRGFFPDREIQLYPPRRNVVFLADEFITDAIFNLLSNAVKYTPSTKVRIDVEALERGEEVLIRVIDRGRGVPDEVKELIFQRFSRLENSSRGLGLGLHLVKSVVERYGGRIWVEDRVSGDHARGSVFCVALPRRAEA